MGFNGQSGGYVKPIDYDASNNILKIIHPINAFSALMFDFIEFFMIFYGIVNKLVFLPSSFFHTKGVWVFGVYKVWRYDNSGIRNAASAM